MGMVIVRVSSPFCIYEAIRFFGKPTLPCIGVNVFHHDHFISAYALGFPQKGSNIMYMMKYRDQQCSIKCIVLVWKLLSIVDPRLHI